MKYKKRDKGENTNGENGEKETKVKCKKEMKVRVLFVKKVLTKQIIE